MDQRGKETISSAMAGINSEIYISSREGDIYSFLKLGILGPGGKPEKLGILGKEENLKTWNSRTWGFLIGRFYLEYGYALELSILYYYYDR